MESKRSLGQFYTTNVDYILQRMQIPVNFKLIEPFVGNGDILKWIGHDIDEIYDLDPKIKNCKKRDTLKNPPEYTNKFVITNPPYLNKNKSKDKTIFNLFGTDDLYKAAIKSFVDGNVSGGILIVPLNFISQHNSKIRKLFFEKYHITKLNIFEETVFDDTSYTICSFEFFKGKHSINKIDTVVYPSNSKITLELSEYDNWTIGYNLFPKIKSKYNIRRLVLGDSPPNNNLFLYAIDGGTPESRIRLVLNKNHLYGTPTDRSFCSFVSNIPIEDEEYIVSEFNSKLEKLRDNTHSLFLTNYRNSTEHYARKRIGFNQAYSLIEQILLERTKKNFW